MNLRVVSGIGMITLIAIAWIFSTRRDRFPWRTVLSGLALEFAVAALISVAYLIFGHQIIAIYTNQAPIRTLAVQFLPWVVLMPIVSVWCFLFDGVYIGATRAPELRNSATSLPYANDDQPPRPKRN